MIRSKQVRSMHIIFDDGSAESWTFPEGTVGYYKETTNTTTERDPQQEHWHEHVINWISDRKRPVRG